MFHSLRTRLIALFVALTVIPLIFVGILITLRGYNTLQDQAITLQDEIARRTAISLESFFKERRAELLTLTQVYGLDTFEFSAQQNILLALMSQQSAYYQFALVAPTGMETLRLTRGEVVTDADLLNRANEPLFQTAVESKNIAFGEVYFNTTARDRLITIAIPVEDLFTGNVGYVLIAEIRFQNIGDAVLRELNLNSGEDVFIVNSTGTIIAHRDPNLVIRETTYTLPTVGGRQTGLDGVDAVVVTEPVQLGNQQLFVVAETDFSTATVLANDLSSLAFITTLIALGFAVVIIAIASNRLVKPLIEMANVATSVQNGDLSVRVNAEGRDETAQLGRAFNQMTAQLQYTLTGLQNNVKQLETSNQERDKLIKDLQAAKRLAEENSRLKSEFLSMMSHELRTPLNAIEGFTGVVLKRIGGAQFNDKTEEYLNRVQSNSRRLLHLINDFLDLSRVEAGRLELAHQPFTPVALANRWRDEISVLAEKKGIGFDLTLDPTLPETLYGDEEAISKVVVNLLSNAIKFTEKGAVGLKIDRHESTWRITVSDTGIGIPPHAREFIFEEFRQVDQSSRRKYGGTGLGLAIVQKYTRSMGGNVSVKSEMGSGSTFTVSLPLQMTA